MTSFNPSCRLCPRLSSFLDEVKAREPDYFARPVAPFGVDDPGLLIVGLAPGMHGANRTGRPFTGDYAGELLYSTLHKFGFATSPQPLDAAGWANPDLALVNCRITNAVKCLPPENKPETSEVVMCNRFLAHELAGLRSGAVVLALGNVAHGAVLRALGLKIKDFPFGHGARHVMCTPSPSFDKLRTGQASPAGGEGDSSPLTLARQRNTLTPAPLPQAGEGSLVLYDSYHCSRYNTQTRRLTEAMFHAVFAAIKENLPCPM
jgi:uracil-DNA glycosylase